MVTNAAPAVLPWQAPGTWVRLAALAVAYYLAAEIGLAFALPGSVASPVWPPAGLAVAAVAMWGLRAVPAVAVGAFAANWMAGVAPEWALLMAAGNASEAGLAGWFIARAGGKRVFDSLVGIPRYAAATFLASLVAATLGLAALMGSGAVDAASALAVWATWYLGDVAGIAVITPVILLAARGAWHRPAGAHVLEGTAVASTLALSSYVVFGLFSAPLTFLVVIPMVWLALRFGPLASAAGLLALSIAAILGTAAGHGPFHGGPEPAAFLILQTFLISLSLLSLALAALGTDRRRASRDLELRVTERTRRLEEEVEERRRADVLLVEAQRIAQLGTWRWDITKPNAEWSPELFRIYGLDAATHVPTYADYLARVHPDDVERVKAATEAVFKDQRPYSHDERIRRPDGSWRTLHTWAQAVTDREGKLVALVGTCQDITERAAQEHKFRALLESAPDAMVIVDAKGNIALVNGQAEKLFGYSRADMVGQSLELLVPQRFHGVHPHHQEKYAKDPKQRPMGAGLELFARRKDGSEFPVEISLSPIETPEGKLVCSAIRDVSGRRAAEGERRKREAAQQQVEKLQQQADFKTNFLRTAAHELGTPLTPIRIQLSIMKRLLAGADQERAFAILERNLDRLNVLVRDLLESARLQSGRLKLNPRPMDLAGAVHEVVESFQEPAILGGVKLDTRGDPELPIVADPDRITQVLYNLLSNAMKFTPSGGHVTVDTTREGDRVQIRVTDTGSGFTLEQGSRLFQPFSQVHDAMQRTRAGSGLGLYICRGIVEQHGGTIDARSDGPDKGAVFTVRLPPTANLDPTHAAAAEPEVPRSGLGLQKTA